MRKNHPAVLTNADGDINWMDTLDPKLQEHIARTKAEMDQRCRDNIEDINQRCAYGGEPFADHKERYDACKEWLPATSPVSKERDEIPSSKEDLPSGVCLLLSSVF